MPDWKTTPKKSLGQNFLVDGHVAQRIIEEAGITRDDTVVEIGPGHGVLTRGLAERAGRVVAVELDERLIEGLRAEHAELSNLEILHADALKFDFGGLGGPLTVVANLPYYISTPILTRLVSFRTKIRLMVLMLQKEVAVRIAAPPGGREYGYLSVMVQLYTEPELLFTVKPGSFKPAPKVDSAVVRLTVLNKPAAPCRDYARLEQLVSAAFSQRRKTLKNALRSSGLFSDEAIEAMGSTGIDPSRRAETLTVAEFAALSDFLFDFPMA